MTVYVDPAIHPWRGKMWCHLTADSDEELHEFAVKLGLKRAWFQHKNRRTMPHYDITENKRHQAINLGAVELTCRDVVQKLKEYRERAGICAPAETTAPS